MIPYGFSLSEEDVKHTWGLFQTIRAVPCHNRLVPLYGTSEETTMNTFERMNRRPIELHAADRKTVRRLQTAAILIALAIAAGGLELRPACAQATGSRPAPTTHAAGGPSSTVPSSVGTGNSTAPKRVPLISPEFAEELQRKYGPGGTHSNPAWNPDIQEGVMRQLEKDGFFEREPPTPWYVPARKIAQAIFAFSMLIVGIRQYRAAKKAKNAGSSQSLAGDSR
jgi:hypothetical protein